MYEFYPETSPDLLKGSAAREPLHAPEDPLTPLLHAMRAAFGVDGAFVAVCDDVVWHLVAWEGSPAPAAAPGPFCEAVQAVGGVYITGSAAPLPFLEAAGARWAAGLALPDAAGVVALLDARSPSPTAAQEAALRPWADAVAAALHARQALAEARDRVAALEADQRRVEQVVRVSEERYRAYVEQSVEGLWCYEFAPPVSTAVPVEEQIRRAFEGGRLVMCNDAMARMYGFERADELAQDSLVRRIPLNNQENRTGLLAFFSSGYRITDAETVEYNRDGTPLHFSNNVVGIIEEGHLVRVWGSQIDVTERKRVEEALRTSQHLLSSINHNLTEGIYRSTPEGEIVYVNEAMARMFGFASPAEMQAVRAPQLYHDPARRAELVAQTRSAHGFKNEEVEFIREDGTTFWGLVSSNATLDDRGRVRSYDGAVSDVTRRKQAAQALQESEERWRRLVENHPDPILITIEAEVVYINEAGARIFGATVPEEIYGRSVLDFVAAPAVAHIRGRVAAVARGETTPLLEYQIVGLDAETRYVESSSVPVIFKGQRAAQTMMRDTTARRRYERDLIAAKEQAVEMARLKSSFLANMSHEIRTPLTAIIGFADVLAEEATEEGREFAQLIRQSGQRLMQTLNSVLDLAQLEGGTLELAAEHVDATEVAEQVLALFTVKARERGLDLRLEAPGPLVAWLDAGAFSRVLTNLISNAMKFTPEGHIEVRLADREGTLELQVADTGIGISTDFLPRLFGEFYQESSGMGRGYEGSGLGLAITRRLVELMGGTIDVSSQKGAGSVFTVRIPPPA